MKRLLLSIFCAVLITFSFASPATSVEVQESFGTQSGYEKLAPTTATGITASLITPTSGAWLGFNAKVAIIKCLGNVVNFRCDGTNPTATNGMQLAVGDYWVIVGTDNVKNFRCIDTAAGASDIRVLLYFY